MAQAKTSKKKFAPKTIIVALHPYNEVFVYKTVKEAFEEGEHIVYTYDLVKKQQIVARLEDI